ncbi:hypothetical protein [Clostridium sp.]|uniref:hypothetical protein n=1 Tax=Clostridium sp. TaxID=1506 RepID=UPI0028406C5E|nr:hypothetical protein [Clostridium sp.]MDR3597882.1 hypothetical protein [Clostridium sp.]
MYNGAFKITLFHVDKIRILMICFFCMYAGILLGDNISTHFTPWILKASILFYLTILIVDIYMFINTKSKLIEANLNIGIQLMILSINIYSYILFNTKLYLFLIIIYILIIYFAAMFIFKKRVFSYKSHSKSNPYVWLGAAIGGGFIRSMRSNHLDDFYQNIIVLSCCCILSLLTMFISVQMICKYIYISKYKNTHRFYLDFD